MKAFVQILWLAISVLLGYQMSGVLIDLNTDDSMNQFKEMAGLEYDHLGIFMATNKPAAATYDSGEYWMRVGLFNSLAVLALIPMCQIRAADAEIGARAGLTEGRCGSAEGARGG